MKCTTIVCETKNIYATVDVKVRETLQFSNNTVNYAIAQVTGEEDSNDWRGETQSVQD
ncbi:MAG: hypothetical protein SH857_11045 [Chitinophagales bacterium]|nr:hypothetical protein [Chitinophagales bacterium]